MVNCCRGTFKVGEDVTLKQTNELRSCVKPFRSQQRSQPPPSLSAEEMYRLVHREKCQASLHDWGAANQVVFEASKESQHILDARNPLGSNFKILSSSLGHLRKQPL